MNSMTANRPTVEKIIADLAKYAGWEAADSPRAATMREAALVLQQLTPNGGYNEMLAGDRYSTATHEGDRQMRLTLCKKDKILAYIVLEAEEIYELGKNMLKTYDKLEGIE